MSIRMFAVVSTLLVSSSALIASDVKSGGLSATNQPVSTNQIPADAELKAKLKADREKARVQREEKQAALTKAMNDTLPKDEPKVFEWDATRCREELAKVKERETTLRAGLVTVHSDPEISAMREAIAKLSAELAAKRLEYSKKIREKTAAATGVKDADTKRAEAFKELQKLSSLRVRIETRLAKLNTAAAKTATTNSTPVAGAKAGNAPL